MGSGESPFLTTVALWKGGLKCLEELLATTYLWSCVSKDIDSESIFDLVVEFPRGEIGHWPGVVVMALSYSQGMESSTAFSHLRESGPWRSNSN